MLILAAKLKIFLGFLKIEHIIKINWDLQKKIAKFFFTKSKFLL